MHKIFATFSLAIILILTASTISLASWQVNLEISTPDPNSDNGTASNKLTIGTDTTATEGYDNHLDTIALLDGPIQAYIPHPEYPINQQKLWRDYRSESLPKEWGFEIASSGENNPIKITWKIETQGDLNFKLIDKESNHEIAMASSTEYSYSNTSTIPKRFLLKVTEDLNTNPSTGGQSNTGISSGGSSKGGGCGYIINSSPKGNSTDNSGQIAISVSIILMPMFLPFQHHIRRCYITKDKT